MSEPMTVYTETWPVAADAKGLWLVSGRGPWRSRLPVPADSEPHAEVELTLTGNGIDLSDVALLHSTSWRINASHTLLTYLAVVRRPGFVRENWPEAEPISPRLPDAVGKPLPHGAAEPPLVREVDVLLHGLRHAKLLIEYDATAAAAFDEHWLRHLENLRPSLAGMYDEVCDVEGPAVDEGDTEDEAEEGGEEKAA